MKNYLMLCFGMFSLFLIDAQDMKAVQVPAVVRDAFSVKYSSPLKVHWEREKGNYEANWGGRSGEDHSAMFTPGGLFVEIVDAIKVNKLPAIVRNYVTIHYKGAAIKEAGRITDSAGRMMFQAEIKGHDLVFDNKGMFFKED